MRFFIFFVFSILLTSTTHAQHSFPRSVRVLTPVTSPHYGKATTLAKQLFQCGLKGFSLPCYQKFPNGSYRGIFSGYYPYHRDKFYRDNPEFDLMMYAAYPFLSEEDPNSSLSFVMLRRDTFQTGLGPEAFQDSDTEFYITSEFEDTDDSFLENVFRGEIKPDLIYKQDLDPKSLEHIASSLFVDFTSRISAARALIELENTAENQKLLKTIAFDMIRSREFSAHAFEVVVSSIELDSRFISLIEKFYLDRFSPLSEPEKEFVSLLLGENSVLSKVILQHLLFMISNSDNDPYLRLRGIELFLPVDSSSIESENQLLEEAATAPELAPFLEEIYNGAHHNEFDLRRRSVAILSQIVSRDSQIALTRFLAQEEDHGIKKTILSGIERIHRELSN